MTKPNRILHCWSCSLLTSSFHFMDMKWIDISGVDRQICKESCDWLVTNVCWGKKVFKQIICFCWSIKRAVIGWCPKFVEAQTRSDFFTELRLPTCQPAALLSSCLFFLVHFFRKQIWQIGKIATCLEIFSDSFLIHSKPRNNDIVVPPYLQTIRALFTCLSSLVQF